MHAGHTRVRWLAGITGLALALVLIGVMLAAELREGPPPPVDQQAVATRLEPAARLIAELGVGMWLDNRACRTLMTDLDETYSDPQDGSCANEGRPFTSGVRAAFDRIATDVAGVVPGGRIRIISVAEDHTDAADGGPVRRSITFDSPLDTWEWTWSEDPRPGEIGNLSDHWRFTERRRNDG